jgi:SAM-dependent methyltransferase
MSRPLRERANLVDAQKEIERFKPPAYPRGGTGLKARMLRFLDLQTGTIWQDLSNELPKVSGTVVDVGCGAQPYRGLFSASARYLAIDHADTRGSFGGEAAPDTIYYTGERWPLDSQIADFILCTETLEHILNLDVFLAEMHRCLKPGGRVMLTIPFAARWHFIPHDYWRPTPSALNHLLTKAGFEDVGVYGRGNQLTVACYKAMGLAFSLLSPQPSNVAFRWVCRGFGVLGLAPTLAAAALANATQGWQGGEDFLGFTVTAYKAR